MNEDSGEVLPADKAQAFQDFTEGFTPREATAAAAQVTQDLKPEDRAAAVAQIAQGLPTQQKIDAAAQVTQDLGPQDKTAAAVKLLQDLDPKDKQKAADQISESQEDTRKTIALGLLLLLAALVATAIAAIFATTIDEARVKDLFPLVFGPIVGLVGTVVGFYFGAKTAKAADGG